MSDQIQTGHGDLPAGERDALISRVVDGAASPGDWERLRTAAKNDPTLWDDLTTFQQDHTAINEAVELAGDLAERIDALEAARAQGGWRGGWLRTGAGWAAAAAVLLAWGVTGGSFGGGPAGVGQVAGMSPPAPLELSSLGADEAWNKYVEAGQTAGRLVSAAPAPVVLEARPTADGRGVEVVYMRQVIERRVTDELYRVTSDEFGMPVRVPEEPSGFIRAGQRRAY